MNLRIAIEGDDLVVERDGVEARMPAGSSLLDRMPHIIRAHLDEETRGYFEQYMAAGLGCAGITVKGRT